MTVHTRHTTDRSRRTRTAAAPMRLLLHSVRGHTYLLGNPTVHPIDTAPPEVGTTFTSHTDIRRYLRHQLRDLTFIHQITVIDPTGKALSRATRTGRSGTGNRWTWHDNPTRTTR